MVDLTTLLPGTGGGGNAGSAFSDAYWHVYNEADPTKFIGLDASPQATGTQLTLKAQAGLSATTRTLVLAEDNNSFLDRQDITDTGAACLLCHSTQVSTGGTFIQVQDTVSGFSCSLNGPSNGYAASRDIGQLDANGALPLCGDGADPPSAARMGKVNRTAQVANIASTKLTNGTAAGFYLVHYVLEDTTADVTAGTVTLVVAWTDDAGATTVSSAALVLTTAGRTSGTIPIYLASGDVTYSTTHTGLFGTAQYALRMRIVAMG